MANFTRLLHFALNLRALSEKQYIYFFLAAIKLYYGVKFQEHRLLWSLQQNGIWKKNEIVKHNMTPSVYKSSSLQWPNKNLFHMIQNLRRQGVTVCMLSCSPPISSSLLAQCDSLTAIAWSRSCLPHCVRTTAEQ